MVLVERIGAAWCWTLVDAQGVSVALGTAADQLQAMETAWRTARVSGRDAEIGYPEIVVRTGVAEDPSRAATV